MFKDFSSDYGASCHPNFRALTRSFVLLVFLFGCRMGATAEDPKPVVVKGNDPLSILINTWFEEGKCAGLEGVWYDNRDRLHSNLGIANYPQLQPIGYTEEELKQRADWGGQRKVLPGKVVVGNSSTASPANQAGSHQRMYYIHPRGLIFLYQQYRTNALYIYPEHRDHDPGTNGPGGYGDLYPANSPYLISSQGSSGSDRVFMRAFLKTIAAFPPETREVLDSKGFLMPALQAIFRKTYKASAKPEDYFTGKAHPSVFDGKLIDAAAMVNLAQAMAPDTIPPLVHLRVLEESAVKAGRDFFEPPMVTGEQLANSPCAIARVIRGPAYRRTMRVSAGDSVDLKDRELKFQWVILRGDPKLITIEPGGENGEEAAISVAYHPRRPIAPGAAMESNRIDIGVFAEAEGSLVSAPAFVSFTSLPSEHRTYSDDGALLEIFYGARSPALGMPPVSGPQWDGLLARFEIPAEEWSPESQVLTAVLKKERVDGLTELAAETKKPRKRLAVANEELDVITAAQKKIVDETNKVRVAAVAAHKKEDSEESKAALDDANAKHNAAKKAMSDGDGGAAELKKEIAGLRSKVVAAIRAGDAPEILRSSFETIRSDPRFFSKNEKAIRAAAEKSSNSKAAGALTAALKRLEFVGVSESDKPSPNERYHLEQRNHDILSDVLFSDFLVRPAGPNYADPRLTAPKNWRDVYHYDEDRELTGWTRFQNGESSEFTEEGDLIRSRKPDGSPDEIVKVRYAMNPKTKRLKMVEISDPKEEETPEPKEEKAEG